MDELDLDYTGALADEFGLHPDTPLLFNARSDTGNGGQVYLKSYAAHEGDEEGDQPGLKLEAMLPGGWTAEPGPTGDVAFPQHLISDQASWTDQAPEFATEDLGDGRTLMTADHGCAYEAAVVYPNGSALRTSWDLDCEGQGREMALGDLRDAMLAMPEIDFDTTGLTPVEDLIEFPDAWVLDESGRPRPRLTRRPASTPRTTRSPPPTPTPSPGTVPRTSTSSPATSPAAYTWATVIWGSPTTPITPSPTT